MPGEFRSARLLEAAEHILGSAGFRRYEISNWCRPGFECRHNLVHWRRGDYLGLGVGASSHRRGERSRRIGEPDEYTCTVLAGDWPVSSRESVTAAQALLVSDSVICDLTASLRVP
jgi:oxygen-independent coproporphyrinogen-3 oxidase